MKSAFEIRIYGRGLLNAGGNNLAAYCDALKLQKSCISFDDTLGAFVGRLDRDGEAELSKIRQEKRLRSMDRAVLMGVLASRQALREASFENKFNSELVDYVLFGSSRGATNTLEDQVRQLDRLGSLHPLTSPLTTAGCFASTIAHDLKVKGGSSSISAACTTGLQAIHLVSGLLMSRQIQCCLVGASEAPNTSFTVQQMKSLGVLSAAEPFHQYPCKPLANDRNGMVLGEGAVALILGSNLPSVKPLARILATASANDLTSLTGISEEGEALQRAIHKATERAGVSLSDIDLIIAHGTGTKKGDAAEINAYRRVFSGTVPYIAAHKWLTGHALAVSPLFSVVLACEYLRGSCPVEPFPYIDLPIDLRKTPPLRPKLVLITALGFGGNASVLLAAA